jgi:hypothetical protein
LRLRWVSETPHLRDGTGDGTGDGMGRAMRWDGMGWDEMGWDGMGWDGMGWDGMGWDGMGWDERRDCGRRRTPHVVIAIRAARGLGLGLG